MAWRISVAFAAMLLVSASMAEEPLPAQDAAIAGAPSELLNYRASYDGILSLGQTLDIADVSLITTPDPEAGLSQSRLEASSERYELVESSYPFRYLLRTLYREQDKAVLAHEIRKQTKRIRHEVMWVDQASGWIHQHRIGVKQKYNGELPVMLASWLPDADLGPRKSFEYAGVDRLRDRLSLLQWVRSLPLASEKRFILPVTNGRDRMVYEITVEKEVQYPVAGEEHPAWKLRFDAYELKGEKREPGHRPIFVWISQGETRIPLRFEARHSVGHFIVEYVGDAPKLTSTH